MNFREDYDPSEHVNQSTLFYCPRCKWPCKSLRGLDSHRRSKRHREGTNFCSDCKTRFYCETDFEFHYANCPGRKRRRIFTDNALDSTPRTMTWRSSHFSLPDSPQAEALDISTPLSETPQPPSQPLPLTSGKFGKNKEIMRSILLSTSEVILKALALEEFEMKMVGSAPFAPFQSHPHLFGFNQLSKKAHLSDANEKAFYEFFAPLSKVPWLRYGEFTSLRDSLYLPSLFGKASVLRYGTMDLPFFFMDLRVAISTFLLKPNIAKKLLFQAPQNEHFGHSFSGTKFREMTAGLSSKPLVFTVFSDKSAFGSFVERKCHPIVMTLENLPFDERNKNENKVLVGWMPVVGDEELSANQIRNAFVISFLRGHVFHRCISLLLQPLREQPTEGYTFYVGGGYERFKVLLGTYLGDKQDIYKLARKYCSSWSSLGSPCYCCQIPGLQLHSFEKFPPRDLRFEEGLVQNCIDALKNKDKDVDYHLKLLESISMFPIEDGFAGIEFWDPRRDFGPDQDHIWTGGIVKWVLKNLSSLANDFSQLVKNVDRISHMGTFDELHASVVTEKFKDHVKNAKLSRYILFGLKGCTKNPLERDSLFLFFKHFLHFWNLNSKLSINEDELKELLLEQQKCLEHWSWLRRNGLIKASGKGEAKEVGIPKFHDGSHLEGFIRAHGVTTTAGTRGFEKTHDINIKKPAQHTNNKNEKDQLRKENALRTTESVLDSLHKNNQIESTEKETHHKSMSGSSCEKVLLCKNQNLERMVKAFLELRGAYLEGAANTTFFWTYSGINVGDGKKAYATDSYHEHKRYDFVELSDGRFGRLKHNFQYKDCFGTKHNFCVVELFRLLGPCALFDTQVIEDCFEEELLAAETMKRRVKTFLDLQNPALFYLKNY